MENIRTEPHEEGVLLVAYGKEYPLSLEAAEEVCRAYSKPRDISGPVVLCGEQPIWGTDTRLKIAEVLRDALSRL